MEHFQIFQQVNVKVTAQILQAIHMQILLLKNVFRYVPLTQACLLI